MENLLVRFLYMAALVFGVLVLPTILPTNLRHGTQLTTRSQRTVGNSSSVSREDIDDNFRAASLADFNKDINEAYKELLEGLDSGDDEARKKAFQPMLDYCASLENEPVESVRSVAARMHHAISQFTGLVGAKSSEFSSADSATG
jgi:hypothetical protein